MTIAELLHRPIQISFLGFWLFSYMFSAQIPNIIRLIVVLVFFLILWFFLIFFHFELLFFNNLARILIFFNVDEQLKAKTNYQADGSWE